MTQTSASIQSPSDDNDSILSEMQMLSLEPTAVSEASETDNTSVPAGPCAKPPTVYISTRPGDEQDYPNCCRAHQVSFETYVQSIEEGRASSAGTVVIRAYDMYTQLLSSGGSFRLPDSNNAPVSSVNTPRPFSAGTFTLPSSDASASSSCRSASTPLPSYYAPMPSPAPTYKTVEQDAAATGTASSSAEAAAPALIATNVAAVLPTPAQLPVANVLPPPIATPAPATVSAPTIPGGSATVYHRNHTHIPAPATVSAPANAGASAPVIHAHTHVPAHLRWYTVTRGKKPGIHRGWHLTSPLVIGVRTSSFAGFDTREEALQVWQESLLAGVVEQL